MNLTQNYYEYEQGTADIIVKGRLFDSYDFWKEINAYPFILDVIKNGYKIPFYSTPPSVFLPNNRSSLNHGDFVESAIHDLLVRGLVIECSSRPIVVNPLTVSIQSNGKKRLILDLRHVNKHLWKSSIKFEDIRTAMYFLKQGDFCFKFDLTSAYHHISIFEPHTLYLGFSWRFGDKVRFFRFQVLPFGLSSAAYIFTKLTRPLIKKWRSEGKQVLMYLDDGFGRHSSYDKCLQVAMEIKQDLIKSGFVPKVEKSMWNPSTEAVFLGYHLNLSTGIISIPERRLHKIRQTIGHTHASLQKSEKVHVRLVASLVGQIISMSFVTGNVVYIMTKCLSYDILQAVSWNESISLSKDCMKQIEFWQTNLDKVIKRNFILDHSVHTVVYSDASGTGFGGYTVDNPMNISHGMWDEEESCKSSTWRELVAVQRVFVSLLPFLEGKTIKWFSDNKNVVSIVEKGSMKTDLQNIAINIFDMCLANSISLHTEWVPRSENVIADEISRLVDHDEWLYPTVFLNL